MKVIVFVGLPGAGKSTKAKEFESQGYVIHSVDSIRNEFNLHEQNDISKVLNIFNERLIIDLNAKKNIVYDSTNLSVKHRKDILNILKAFNCEKICYVFIVPIEVCKQRNAKWIGYLSRLVNKFKLRTAYHLWKKLLTETSKYY